MYNVPQLPVNRMITHPSTKYHNNRATYLTTVIRHEPENASISSTAQAPLYNV